MFKNLTEYEIDTLPQTYNLTDGHAFRRWFAAEETIIDQSPSLFRNNTRRQQRKIEREYIRDFLRMAGQTYDAEGFGYMFCFTASMAFEIVANYLRLNDLSVKLIA
jgi:hypothetical protein